MHEQAYLVAVYWLGSNYHSGQWSRGYRLTCMAEMRMSREFAGCNIGRMTEQLMTDKLYPKGCKFRQAVATCLRSMRHSRKYL